MQRNLTILWIALFLGILIWSGLNPKDRFTWWLEVAPALVAFAVLIFTYKRFPLTPMVYWLILFHCCILFVGGRYTYAEVPLFDWIKDALHQTRNNYDKVGHFTQGFVPAMVAREIFIRNHVVNGKGWTFFLVSSVCLAISAVYELLEWAAAAGTGESAEAFLGTQGYAWDTQSDMLIALLGAICGQILLAGLHDAQLRRRAF